MSTAAKTTAVPATTKAALLRNSGAVSDEAAAAAAAAREQLWQRQRQILDRLRNDEAANFTLSDDHHPKKWQWPWD